MKIWLKNTAGKDDAVLTMTILSLAVVLVKFAISGITLDVAGHAVNFGVVDAGVIGTILTPTLGAYVARRYTEARHGTQKKEEVQE